MGKQSKRRSERTGVRASGARTRHVSSPSAEGAPRWPRRKTVALNRRARHEFSIEDTFEAGIVLTGTEIKSIRAGKVNLADAYARIERDEAWLIGAHIAPFEQANRYNHEPKRDPQAAPPPLRDRRAARQDEVEGPDARPAAPLPHRQGPGQARARARPRQAGPRPPPRHRRSRRRSATWPASSPTPSEDASEAVEPCSRRRRRSASAGRSARSTSTRAASPAG